MTDQSSRTDTADSSQRSSGKGESTPVTRNGTKSTVDGESMGSEPDYERIRARFIEKARSIETHRDDQLASAALRSVTVSPGVLTVAVDFQNLDTSTQNRIGEQLRGIGLSIEGVDHVRIESDGAQTASGHMRPNGIGTVIAVAGSKGGVGKTTVTLALARALDEAGLAVGVFDADFQAPDVTELLGLTDPLGATATGKPEPANVGGVQVVSLDLIAGERPGLWTGARTHDVLADLFGAVAWTDRDVLLVDLPPGLGDVTRVLCSRARPDGAVVVTTPADVGVRNAERTVSALDAYDVPVRAVVENLGDGAVIHEGSRDVSELFLGTSADPVYVTVPFDSVLQHPASLDVQEVSSWTGEALGTLTDAIRSCVDEDEVPANAVDLTGMPTMLCERQVALEFTAPDGPRPVIVADEEDIHGLIEADVGYRVHSRDLPGGRRLLSMGGEPV